MKDVPNKGDYRSPVRSVAVEEALRELAQLPLTEACVAGACDFCLYQADSCAIVGQRWEHSHLFGHAGENKTK